MAQTLCEMLQEIVDDVCNNTNNIKAICSSYNEVGPVSSGDWTTLKPQLDAVKANTDTIFSPVNPPSYTPYNAGTASSYDPDGKTTLELGNDACARAQAAYQRACVDNPANHDSSATYLRDFVVIIDALIIQADPG